MNIVFVSRISLQQLSLQALVHILRIEHKNLSCLTSYAPDTSWCHGAPPSRNKGFLASSQPLREFRPAFLCPKFLNNAIASPPECVKVPALWDGLRPEGNGLKSAPVWGWAAIITLNSIPCSAGWSVTAHCGSDF